MTFRTKELTQEAIEYQKEQYEETGNTEHVFRLVRLERNLECLGAPCQDT